MTPGFNTALTLTLAPQAGQGNDFPPLLIEERGCLGPEISFLSGRHDQGPFGINMPTFSFQVEIPGFYLWIMGADQVDQHGPGNAVKRHGIGIMAFPQHVLLANACQLFHGTVPGYHLLFTVNNKSRIWQELDDVFQLLMGKAKLLFCKLSLCNICNRPLKAGKRAISKNRTD